MRRTAVASLLSTSAMTLMAGCGGGDPAPSEGGSAGRAQAAEASSAALTATLVDPEGARVGRVEITEAEEGLQVVATVEGLPPGFHGFHVHAVGACEPDSASPADPSVTGDFLSAGGHLGAGESDHGRHPGDLPVLYVAGSGTGSLTMVTDALTLADLVDDDGSAVMVHANADNYANVPERYAPAGPDDMTRNTGDAGGRIACGPVEEG